MQADGISRRSEGMWVAFIGDNKLPPEGKLKDMIRKGVPPTLRPWVWMEVSGAAAKKAAVKSSNYFTNMALAGERSPFLKEIDQDIAHTFPNHRWLHEADGQAALRRVLAAYSVHNEEVGYCRPMVHIVALLLVALNRNQETAFWLLAALVEDILAPGTYDPHLMGCLVEMKALDELIAQKLPRLATHLASLEAEVSILATDWFLTLFATCMPAETVARMWDALFNEGSKVLYRTALALLKSSEPALLACDNAGELLMAVRQHASTMHDRDRLMETAFEGIGGLPMAAIERYREQRSAEVEAAVRERQVVRNRHQLRDTLSSKQKGASEEEAEGIDEQVEGMKINEQLNELGKQAGVLGRQAASNLKKGFGSFMAGAKELSGKAQAEMHKRSSKGSSGGGGVHEAPPAAAGRAVGRPAAHPIAEEKATALALDDDESRLLQTQGCSLQVQRAPVPKATMRHTRAPVLLLVAGLLLIAPFANAAIQQSAAKLQSENPASVENFEFETPAVKTANPDALLTDEDIQDAEPDASAAAEDTVERSQGVWQAAKEKIASAFGTAHDAALHAGDAVADTATDAKTKASAAASDVSATAEEAAASSAARAKAAVNSAGDSAAQAGQAGKERVAGAAGAGKERAGGVLGKVKEVLTGGRSAGDRAVDEHMAAERFAAEEALLAEADAVETRGEGLLDDTRDTAGKLQDKAAGVFEQAKQALKGDKTRKAKVQKVEVEL
ncbi:hypothetical protein OEZ86_011544 [Tetradesmus obliquus]|nr:hypothetical protein OEZ86_011544 [Tetradesmus obliquus]